MKKQKEDSVFEQLPIDGDLIKAISSHAWFYKTEDNMMKSAIPVTPNLALTFRHGENKKLIKGDIVKLWSYQNQQLSVTTRVVLINDLIDLIVLQSESLNICDRNVLLEALEPKKGMKYVMVSSIIFTHFKYITMSYFCFIYDDFRWAILLNMVGQITYHFRQELLQAI